MNWTGLSKHGVRFSQARKWSRKAPETAFWCFTREFRAQENVSLFPVNFTGALELPKLGTDFIAIKLHLQRTVFGNKDGRERPK